MAAPETDFDEGYGWVQQCHEYPRWTFARHFAHTRTDRRSDFLFDFQWYCLSRQTILRELQTKSQLS